jgi:hypothetical protein
MKPQIQYIEKKEKYGFIGMNKRASKAHKIKWKHKKHPEHTIEVYSGVPKGVRVYTIRHEEMEEYLMRVKHYSYQKAHKIALRFEKLNKPFPKSHIKENLNKMHFKI